MKKIFLLLFFNFSLYLVGIKNNLFATITQQNEDTVIFLNIKLGKENGETEDEKIRREKRIADSLQAINNFQAIKTAVEKRILDSLQMIKIMEDKRRMELELMQYKLLQEQQQNEIKRKELEDSKKNNYKSSIDSIAIIKDYIKENSFNLTPVFEPLTIPLQPIKDDQGDYFSFKFSIYEDARLLFDSYQIYAVLTDKSGKYCDSLGKIKLFATYNPCKNAKIDPITTEISEECYVHDDLRFLQEIRSNLSYITMKFSISLLADIGFFDCHRYNSQFVLNTQDYWRDRAFKIYIRGVKILSNGAKIYGPYSAYRLPTSIKLACGTEHN